MIAWLALSCSRPPPVPFDGVPVPDAVPALSERVDASRLLDRMGEAHTTAPDPAPFARFRGDAHPLLGHVSMKGPVHRGSDRRRALYAPTGSAFGWEVALGEAPHLVTACSALPMEQPGGTVVCEVRVAVDGREEVAGSRRTPASPDEWVEIDVDLTRWAGRGVTLTLATSRLGEAEPVAHVAWAEPVVIDRSRTGRLVALVGIDTLGAARATDADMPALAALAARGTRFDAAWSAAPWTLPAFASMLTGLPAGAGGTGGRTREVKSGRRRVPDGVETVSERLRAQGWATGAWINNPFLTEGFGLAQGFDRYVDYGTRSRPGAGRAAVDGVAQWLDATRGQDRFVFVHLMEPHGPYRPEAPPPAPPGPFVDGMGSDALLDLARGRLVLDDANRAHVEALHTASIRDADRVLGEVAALLDGANLLVVTADHGEELWEHGRFEHGHSLYDELLRVPLVVVPGPTPGARVSEPVPVSGVAGLLLDAAGVPGPPPLPTAGGGTLYGAERWYAVRDGWKLVVDTDRAGPGSRGHTDLAGWYDRSDPTEATRGVPPPGVERAAWRDLFSVFLPSLADHVVVAVRDRAVPVRLPDAAARDLRALAWPTASGRVPEPPAGSAFRLEGVALVAVPVASFASDATIGVDRVEHAVASLAAVDPAAFFAPGSGAGTLVGVVPGGTPPGADLQGELEALGYAE